MKRRGSNYAGLSYFTRWIFKIYIIFRLSNQVVKNDINPLIELHSWILKLFSDAMCRAFESHQAYH